MGGEITLKPRGQYASALATLMQEIYVHVTETAQGDGFTHWPFKKSTDHDWRNYFVASTWHVGLSTAFDTGDHELIV